MKLELIQEKFRSRIITMSLHLILLCLITVTVGENIKPSVTVASGKINGHFKSSINGRKYAAFEGIPYARPPVGKYRFKEPQVIKPWKGTWEATYLHTCIQYDHYSNPNKRVIGNEDCLYLNVYTPQLNESALLDVIIHIHGGAFMFGASHVYGEKILMDRNVVFVNINYRLGPLGFLSTEDSVVPGNNGMKDQVLALKWIKNNIQYFGGNSNSITLTGMSAGGASVHLHYMSPLSTDLFHRGFSLSGTALNPWVITENALEKTKKLASSLGCETVNKKEMVDCLRFRPAHQLVQNVEQFFGFLYNPFSPFGVVVESLNTTQQFLPKHPYEILKNGEIQQLPWITSLTQAEGLYPAAEFLADPNYLQVLDKNWSELAAHVLDFNFTANKHEHAMIAKKIKMQYLNGKNISKSNFKKVVQMVGDRLFVSDTQDAARMHAQISTSPVNFYYYTYRGAHSKSETLSRSQENLGSAHGDDLVYVLSSSVDTQTTENDRKMTELLLEMWISYAKTGIPVIGDIAWDQVSKNPEEPLSYLEINSPTEIVQHSSMNLGNAEFWHSLSLLENKNISPSHKDEL